MASFLPCLSQVPPGGAMRRSSTGLRVTAADLAATDWQPSLPLVPPGTPLDLTGATRMLGQTFPALPTWRTGRPPWPPTGQALDDPSFCWLAGYVHAQPAAGTLSDPYVAWSNLRDELQVYPSGGALASGVVASPFSIDSGALAIEASVLPAGLTIPATLASPSPAYLSGTFTSYPYGQTHGVFSARMRIPSGVGLWPAFWLLPVNGQPITECDVMEVLAGTRNLVNCTAHSSLQPVSTVAHDAGLDLSLDYHDYAVDLGPQLTTFYLDGVSVFCLPTPPDWHVRMYMLIDLAVGGWAGTPNPTAFPARLFVERIDVWQRGSY